MKNRKNPGEIAQIIELDKKYSLEKDTGGNWKLVKLVCTDPLIKRRCYNTPYDACKVMAERILTNEGCRYSG